MPSAPLLPIMQDDDDKEEDELDLELGNDDKDSKDKSGNFTFYTSCPEETERVVDNMNHLERSVSDLVLF